MRGQNILQITLWHLYYCTGWLLTASRQRVNQCIGEYGEHKLRNKVACQISLTSNHIFLNKPKKPQPATRDFFPQLYKKRSPKSRIIRGLGNCALASATFYSTKSLSIKRRCSLSTDPPIIMQKPGVQASPLLHSPTETLSVRGRDIIAAFIQWPSSFEALKKNCSKQTH